MGEQNQMMEVVGATGQCVLAIREGIRARVRGRATPSRTGGGRDGRAEDDLSPSSEFVPDPELSNSIVDPDMRRRLCNAT